MSIEEISDLEELFEYDEFDSYDENAYQSIIANDVSHEGGVPLSIELSESLSKNQTPENELPCNNFTKAPEIFLRIDASTTTSNSSIYGNDANCCGKTSNKIEQCSTLNSLESSESNDGPLSTTNRDECLELQYENEFGSSDETDCEFVQSTCRQQNNTDNDYEDLLLEGIDFDKFLFVFHV